MKTQIFRIFKGFFSISVFLLLSITLFQCTGANKESSRSSSKKILRRGNGAELQDLDPQVVTGVPENNVVTAIFEGLFTPDPKTLEPLPGVAESWTLSPDKTVYTFKINPKAKWSNGDTITANDFLYSWKRILTPALAAEYSYMLYSIKNAEAYNKGTLKDFSEVGVKALDAQTLAVTLNAPTPYFLSLLLHYSLYPVPQKAIEKFNAFESRGTKWTRPENIIGNGPYKLKSWELNKVLIVEKNPNYWNKDLAKIDEIHFYPIDATQVEERMFRNGELDATYEMPTHKIESYRNEHPKELRNTPFLGSYFYRLNTGHAQLKDKRVRQALVYSIDRKALVEKVSKGGELAAVAFTPPKTGLYTPKNYLNYDLEKAKKLLAAAGYPNGKGFKGFEILYNNQELHRTIAEAIQQMWKVNLGINVTLRNQEWKVYLDTVNKKDYDVARAAWVGDYPDPNSFLDLWVTDGGNNNTGWSNKKYDALIREANLTGDQKRRMDLFTQAEDILMEELPIVPIYTYTTKYLVSEKVSGWYPNIIDWHPVQYLDIEK